MNRRGRRIGEVGESKRSETHRPKGATLPIRCPRCAGTQEVALDWHGAESKRSETQLRCPHCGSGFPSVGGVLDLRVGLEVERGRWRLETFERAYREVGPYRDHRDWARRSGIPETVDAHIHARVKGWLMDHLEPQPGQALLDVGCGSGFLLCDIRERHPGLRLCGVDVSLAHLASLARRKRDDHITDILALASDGEDLPFPDSAFDWLTCSEVLEHIHRPERAIQEMYRVLKPGGSLLVTTPNRAAVVLWEAAFWLPRRLRGLLRRWPRRSEGAYDEALSGPRLRAALEQAGFLIERFRPVVFLPHESYFQFFPPWLVRFWLWRARFIERHLRGPLAWQGLRYIVRARKPETAAVARPQRVRVLYVIDDLLPGGAERVLVDRALRLPDERYRVSVLTLFARGPLAEELQRAGLSVSCLGLSRRATAVKALVLWRCLRRLRPGIVHLFRVGSRVFVAPVAWAAGVRHIIGCWGNFPQDRPRFWRWVDRLSSCFMTHAEVCSGAVARALSRGFLPSRLETDVIHNGTPLKPPDSRARPRARRSLSLVAQELVAGTVANLHWQKGYPYLLRAAALVRQAEPRFRLTCIGGGADRDELERQVQELGLEGTVRFLGRRLDVPELLPAFDVFVLASVTEPFGLVLTEAMAAGLPCVATRVGGIPEVVVDGETGLLVPPRDPEALAQAILRLLSDPALGRRMGRAGQRRVQERFSIERMVADVERMYAAFLGTEGSATDLGGLPESPPSGRPVAGAGRAEQERGRRNGVV